MVDNLFSIKEKVILITGVGRGIGRDLAVGVSKRYAFVYCVDNNFPDKIPDHLANYLFEGKCDITNIGEFKRICDDIFKRGIKR